MRFIRHKSEVFQTFRYLIKELEKGTGRKFKALISDRGGEFLSNDFQQYLKRRGIHHQLTTTDSPQQNGVAERMNRTLIEKAHAMIAAANVSKTFSKSLIKQSLMKQRRICLTKRITQPQTVKLAMHQAPRIQKETQLHFAERLEQMQVFLP